MVLWLSLVFHGLKLKKLFKNKKSINTIIDVGAQIIMQTYMQITRTF